MLQFAALRELTAVTDDTFAATVLASERPVVLDFWATWCPACAKLAPIIAELAAEFGDRVLVASINADDNPRTARDLGVMSLPTLLVFRGGELTGQIIGYRPKSFLRETLSGYAGR
jgi:thioredoxin 1